MTHRHSLAPWQYDYNPYTLETAGEAARELAAFEIHDAEGNKLFDTNEDMPSAVQEANACLATGAPALLAALQLTQRALNTAPRFRVGDTDSYQIAAQVDKALAGATTIAPPWEADRSYSVLLLYPDYANDSGTETYYAFVTASDPIEAVALARQQAAAAQEGMAIGSEDFAPLLVTQGQHRSEPLFNK